LTDEDRQVVRKAGSKASTHALIGSLAGIALGGFLAWKLRANRNAVYQAFRTADKPTHIKFADGREEAIPDLTPLLKPTPLGDVVAYTFFGMGGLFLGGETGLLTGSLSAKRTIDRDVQTKARIEKAYRAFKVDVLKKQIEALEGDRESVWTA